MVGSDRNLRIFWVQSCCIIHANCVCSRARAIRIRKSREDGIGGFFTQIGPLYVVHHIWAYDNLEARKEARDAAWSSPGWDECVANTGELISSKDKPSFMLLFKTLLFSSSDSGDGLPRFGCESVFTIEIRMFMRSKFYLLFIFSVFSRYG